MSSGGGERESLANLYRSALTAGAQAAKLDARSDEAHVSGRSLCGNRDIFLRRCVGAALRRLSVFSLSHAVFRSPQTELFN